MEQTQDYDLLIVVILSTWKDTFQHFTELLQKIPEVTELVASTTAGTFLGMIWLPC